MCNNCHSNPCCCNSEKRISSQGPTGNRGLTGQSAYVYIGYASAVTPGTPDVVTGFSATTPQCWIAVKQSTVPLIITQTIFQGLWKKACGDPGTPGTPGSVGPPGPTGPVGPSGISVYLNSQVTGGAFPINISTGIGNTGVDITTGATVTVAVAGTYLIYAQMNFLIATAIGSSPTTANTRFSIKLNGSIPLRYSIYSLNDHPGSWDFSPYVFCVQASLSIGDIIGSYIGLYNPDPGDSVTNYGLLSSDSVITALKIG